MHQPIAPKLTNLMNATIGVLDKELNPKDNEREFSIVLMIGCKDENGEQRVNYISNADRQSMMAAFKDILSRHELRMAGIGGRA